MFLTKKLQTSQPSDESTQLNLPQKKGRYFGLDALRVVSEIFVILAHFGVWISFAAGAKTFDYLLIIGVAGLEAFFVMSGFLIGGMLINIIQREVTLKAWWTFIVRRFLRVYPPYVVWLILLSLFTLPAAFNSYDLLQYFVFMQNFAWRMPPSDWFSISWSLSIEFWFYVSFGTLALIAARIKSLNGFLFVTLIYIFAPVIARCFVPDDISWDFNIRKVTIYQFDGIAYGVLAALWLRVNPKIYNVQTPLFYAGLMLILLTFTWWLTSEKGTFDVSIPFNRVFILNGYLLGITLMLPYLLNVQCSNHRVVRITEWLSDSSYAVYLVHLTVAGWFSFLLVNSQPVLFLLAAVSTSLVLGGISLHLIERPILSRRPR